MNDLDIIVFDFETGGLKAGYNEAIQIAGKAYQARTLEPYPIEQGGEFCSLMKPVYFDRLEKKALECNKKTIEELQAAPDQGVVWKQFVEWVKKFNKKKNKWGAPIAAGKNIRSFDMAFVHELNKLHCPKGIDTVLFGRIQVDLEDFIFQWFENSPDLPKMNMDALRDYFGLSREGGHDALVDVRQTGALIMKFLKLHRMLQSRIIMDKTTGKEKKFITFKDCFKGQAV